MSRYPYNSSTNFLCRERTLETIISTNKSIARFGDGELALALKGVSLPFQSYNPKLAEQLLDIIRSTSNEILICMNNSFMRNASVPWIIKYERSHKAYHKFESILNHNDIGILHRNREFRMYNAAFKIAFGNDLPCIIGDATFLMLGLYYKQYKNGDINLIIDKFRKLIHSKNLLIVCPVSPLMSPSFMDMDYILKSNGAKSVKYIHIPNIDAYAYYNEILHKILNSKCFDEVWLQCGPMATVMAYDLSVKYKIKAYDVGSLNASIQYL